MKAAGEKRQIIYEATIIRLSVVFPNVRVYARKPGYNIFKDERK